MRTGRTPRRPRPADAPGPDDGTGARRLVVVGGLPGSGKTTLLRRLLAGAGPGVSGFDSEQVADRLREAGVHLPYRVLRPAVHVVHRWRVRRGLRGGVPVVLLTDPWTSPRRRRAVLRAARRAGRPVRLVLFDVPPDVAADGQAARGRAISAHAMRRHTDRWADLLGAVRRGDGVDSALVVDRQRADRLTLGDVVGPPAG
jgi:predicted kinase